MTETNQDKGEALPIEELSYKYHVTRQAIYIALRKDKVPYHKINRRIFIYEKDYNDYRAFRYSREKSKFNGSLVYDPQQQELSIRQCAKLMGVDQHKIYYLVYTGKIPCSRKGTAIVIKYDDCVNYLGNNSKQRSFA